jgi:hypothetical protein
MTRATDDAVGVRDDESRAHQHDRAGRPAAGSDGHAVANRPLAAPSDAATITIAVDGLAVTTMSFVLTVNAVNDAPALNAIATPATITEDAAAQTVSLSGITAGGGESQTLTVTATSNNLALIPNPTVTYVSPNPTGSLTYTPVAGASGMAVITVTVRDNGGTASGGVDTVTRIFTVVVTAVADTPSITNASTIVNAQTTSGLVVGRNPADGSEVTHVRVTNITGGTLLKNDGTTPIANGAFITIAEGAAGLRFTPATNSAATGHVTIQASTSNAVAGLGGGLATADIVVNRLPSATTVATSGSPSNSGAPVTFTAAVTPALAAASGTVQFMDGATPLGSPVALSGGSASLVTSALTAGLHAITAVYGGNTLALTSTGTLAGGQTVRPPSRPLLTGADAGGGPHVLRFGALDGSIPAVGPLHSFFAFDPSFTGGVRVAEGDLNGDGVPDYIAGAGPGGAPEIRVIDGAAGTISASFMAFEPAFGGGVFVAAGDVNGDGFVDVIAGSGEGRRGEIKVFSGRDLSLLRDVFVFDAAFRGGVHVAAGDINGDGYADLVAGAGAGGTEVLVLNATDLSTLWTVTPYAGFLGGAWVAAGDVTGDGFADVITGAGAGGGPHVRVYHGRTGVETRNFFAYEGGFAGGVRVAVGDVTGDGRAEIITGPGPGRASEVRVFDAATAALLSNVLAYSFTGGVFVATAAPVNRMAIDTPANGAIVHGPFLLAGWAFDEHPSTAGLDAIHVWAFPVAGGVPTFGGVATLGVARPDVAALYGAQSANAGFYVAVAGLAPGVYDVVIFGHSAVSGTFNLQRVVRITVAP